MTTGETRNGRLGGIEDFVDAALGLSVEAWFALRRFPKPTALPHPVSRTLRAYARRFAPEGHDVRERFLASAQRQVDDLVMKLLKARLSRADLTSMVEELIDVNRLVAVVDIDAVVERVNLIRLANEVIDGVDLPGIIRHSSASVTSEAIQGVRAQGVEADQAIRRAVDRLHLRRNSPSAGIDPNGDGHGPR